MPQQEVIDQNQELPPEDEQDLDPDNPDGEGPDDPIGKEEEWPDDSPKDDEPEGLEVVIEGYQDEQQDDQEQGGKTWVNDLRKRYREAQKKIRELEAQTAKSPESIALGEKPTLAGCDYDDERYEREYASWVERKAKHERQEAEKRAEIEAAQKAWSERVNKYQTEKTALPVADYDDAEATVEEALNQTQIGIILKAADRPAEMIYALGKNAKALQTLANIKDPVDFAVSFGRMMERTKTTPKKSIPAPERVVRGGGGKAPAMTSTNLEKLREEGLRTGDMSKYFEAKRKAG